MKGPSLDAIRKFKQQQERKKIEDERRRIEEKLSILKHRAAQGDRKAKQDLKRIENLKNENQSRPQHVQESRQQTAPKANPLDRPKRKIVETDFEELMKLAKSNNNELRNDDRPRKQTPPTTQPVLPSQKRQNTQRQLQPEKQSHTEKQSQFQRQSEAKRPLRPPQPPPSTSNKGLIKNDQTRNQQPPLNRVTNDRAMPRPRVPPVDIRREVSTSRSDADSYRDRYASSRYRPEPDEYEDEYEDDDFIVDDDDEDVQNELRQTLKSVFHYDKRRCDLREQELDQAYRAIGRVSTFEDLEREERRASRLAAMEDAKALQEDEERRRLKRLRLKKL